MVSTFSENEFLQSFVCVLKKKGYLVVHVFLQNTKLYRYVKNTYNGFYNY